MIDTIISSLIFFGIPVLVLIPFVISLVRYLTAKKKNEKEPGTYPAAEMKKRKTVLIVFSVICGILFTVVVGFATLLFMAVAFM